MKITSSTALAALGDGKAWPHGFRFHPSDEELVLYYLKRKICRRRLKLDIIAETDVYKWDPEDLPAQSVLKTGDRQWFFLSPRDRRYPNGRSNRATGHGYWRATGKDRSVTYNSRTVGTKKTLVFYRGRAPNGERTDWVMHEYTVEEEELKRCQTEQDYYALYKVYKKSGPGPKNGEQYAAPFKEEEWADEEYSDGNIHAVIGTPSQPLNGIPSIDNFRFDGQFKSPLDDTEKMVNQILDDQTPGQLQTNGHAYAPQDVSTFLDVTQSTAPQLHLYEAPEVTSASNISEQDSHITRELKIDDFLGPETTLPTIEKPVNNLPLEALHGLSEFGLYDEATMFTPDISHFDQSLVANQCLNNFENETLCELDYQLPHTYNTEPNSQLLTHDQSDDVVTASESLQGATPLSITGAACDGTSTAVPCQGNQNQAGKDNGDEDQWFSSALWAFVDSIPTPTASASENALMNRNFEQLPSFSGTRITASTAATAVVSNGPPALKRKNRSKGFLYFSVIVALCAILWVLMKGSVMRVLGSTR